MLCYKGENGMRNVLAIAAVAVSTIASVAPADAASYLITYTGIVRGSEDRTGVFGGTGASLDGQQFSATYRLTYPVDGAYEAYTPTSAVYAGGQTFCAAAIQSATLTINGVSRSISGSYQSSVSYFDEQAGFLDGVFHEAQDYRAGTANAFNHYVQAGIWAETNEILSGADFTKPLSYTFAPGDQPLGGFYWLTNNSEGAESEFAVGQFEYANVTVTAGAVPEPTTWAVMIAGMGVVGGAMRRRRTVSTKVSFA
jgi:hypothetical protein